MSLEQGTQQEGCGDFATSLLEIGESQEVLWAAALGFGLVTQQVEMERQSGGQSSVVQRSGRN